MEYESANSGLEAHVMLNPEAKKATEPTSETVEKTVEKKTEHEEIKEVEKPCKKDDEKLTNMKKWKYTLITTVIFLIVVNPYTYKLVNQLVKMITGKFMIASANGCPTTLGLIVHAVVFTLLLRYVMDLKV